MKITRMSIITGTEHTLDVDVTEDQIQAWESGILIQRAMPDLPADMREFLITGITPEEWKEHMVEEDE